MGAMEFASGSLAGRIELAEARLTVDAARAGCDLAVVTAQPGSRSQADVQRAGSTLLYARAISVRPPAGLPQHETP
jgi:hypothetical protein